jgi:hypothetical protein
MFQQSPTSGWVHIFKGIEMSKFATITKACRVLFVFTSKEGSVSTQVISFAGRKDAEENIQRVDQKYAGWEDIKVSVVRLWSPTRREEG